MPSDKPTRPNVVLVMTDDQGMGDLGCTGNPWLHTPHIDAFAADAVRGNDFHVAPLCTPTRGGLMTARHPLRNGAWATAWGRSILKRRERTLAELFASNGYRTALFGKWHLGDSYPYRPQDRGFSHVVAHKGGGVGQTPDFWGNDYFDDTYFANGRPTRFDGYCTDVWFEQAMAFVERGLEEEDTSPFLACIMTNAPHTPYFVEDRYAERYRDNPEIVEPEFYGMISNIDENVGRLRSLLARHGLEENTILVFLTDNGTSGGCECDEDEHVVRGFNAGLRGKKRSWYDGGHKVPFFLRHPAAGLVNRDVDAPMSYLDLMPTLAGLCGVSVDGGLPLDGENRAAVLGGTSPTADRYDDPVHAPLLVMQNQQGPEPPQRHENAVLAGRWRLVCNDELYDIASDPGQRHDIAAEHSDIVACLRRRHAEWWDALQGELAERVPLVVGDARENPMRLDAMDVMGDVAWDQPHVREARYACGRWWVEFARAGNYRFSLRRWPEELGCALDARTDDADDVETVSRATRHHANGETVALVIRAAELTVDGETTRIEVTGSETEAVLFRNCDAGCGELEATLITADGERFGAYYVTVEWTGP